jgi:hypothetical protein
MFGRAAEIIVNEAEDFLKSAFKIVPSGDND